MLRRPDEMPSDAQVRAWVANPLDRPSVAVSTDVAAVAVHLGGTHSLEVAIDLAARDTDVKPEVVAANWEGVRAFVACAAHPDVPVRTDR